MDRGVWWAKSQTWLKQLSTRTHCLTYFTQYDDLFKPSCEGGIVYVLVTQSYPTLCNPMDCSLPGSSVHGILQARILEWVPIPFSRGDLPDPGIEHGSPTLQAYAVPSGWAEEPVKLQSMGLRRVGHDWATSLSLVVFSAVGPGASVEDWPEEAGDGVQASDRRHHWRKDLPPVSAHSCAPRPKLLSRLWVSERERHAARVWSRGFLIGEMLSIFHHWG